MWLLKEIRSFKKCYFPTSVILGNTPMSVHLLLELITYMHFIVGRTL